MNRKFISVVTVSAMLCSFIMPTAIVSADEKNIYSNDFSHESDIEGFSLYDDTNTEGNVSITDDGRLSASMGNDWNDDNGIKKDITSALSGTENGDTLKISMDFASTYWNTATIAKAKLFLEVINGSETRQITIYEGPESVAANDETVTLSGETDSFEYKSGETVYLCVTQPSGMCYVDNISIEKYAADNTAVLFSYSGSSFEGQEFNSIISPYDSSDESWKCGAENGQLTLYEMNSTSWQNGFRIDVTDYIKQYETDTVYSASVRMKSTYWDKKDNGTIGCPAALFLEKNDGTRYPMADAPQQASEVDSDDWAEIAGEAGSIELADNETIYLCMTQTAQCQYITQIEFSVNGSVKEGVTAKPTETVSSEPTASATAESTREPEDGTLFKNELGNKSRAEAAALFDALVTVKAADSAVSVSEWSVMLENSSEALGIKDTNVYNMYAEMSDTDKKSVKSKTDSQNLVSAEEFAKAFAGSVINTALLNAGYYTNIQQILKDNAEWFGINVSSVSSAAAKYILNNVNAGQTSIDSLTKLINTAISNSSSSAVSGGGGGGGSSSGGGSGISGTNLGPYTAQSANTDTTAADSASTVPSNRFNDLSGYDWAENAIYGLFDRDIVGGYGDGTFRPAGNVTREAFVKLIVTAFGVDAAEETKEFSDVTADRWSHDYIQRAAAAGIVTGVTDDSFMSEADITRQDAAVMIYRALLYKGKNLSAGELTFTDRADISEYAADAVAALSGLGIINGMDDGNFSPRNMTSRAQAAVMIYRVISTLF